MMYRVRTATLLFAALAASPLPGAPARADSAPSFLFILADDLGWRDPGYNGAGFYETPHIDRLAAEGMRFTHAYSAHPYCSPSRAAIQTGKNPVRQGITTYIGYHGAGVMRRLSEPKNADGLSLDEVTIGEALGEAGYATGFVGKWHLGMERRFYPDLQGYAHIKGVSFPGAMVHGYFSPYVPRNFSILRETNLPDGPPGEFIEDRLADESIRFLRAQKDSRKPFLLFHSTYAMHNDIDAREETVAKYRAKLARMGLPPEPRFVTEGYAQWGGRPVALEQRNPVYAAMLEHLDDNIGRLLDELDALGLAENTVVVFTSDNGGLSILNTAVARHDPDPDQHDTSNAPLRGGKGYLFDGGIRVPLVVRWPKAVAAGSSSEVPVVLTDFFATLLELAGRPVPSNRDLDSVSLAPLLCGTGPIRRDEGIFWHMPQYGTCGDFPGSALRVGDFKLIHTYEDDAVQLYDLRRDPGEQRDLAAAMPEWAAALRRRLEAWRERTGAEAPWPNPDYDPAKDPRQVAGTSPLAP